MRVKINWDVVGVSATVACAIHCALLPLFLTSLPLFGINVIHNPFFEAGMIALAFAIGCYSLVHGYLKHHHRLLPLFMFMGGFIFLVAKQFYADHQTWMLLPAVILIVAAHTMNWIDCRKARHCHASDCAH